MRYLGRVLILGAFVASCSSTDSDLDDAGLVQQGDAGLPPAFDAGPPEQDAGPPPPPPACDPVTGTGCPDGQICQFLPDLPEGQCRDLAATPKGFGEACNQQLTDCDAGLVCLLFEGETEPTCRQTCRPPEPGKEYGDCGALQPGPDMDYACSRLVNPRTETTAAFGYCREYRPCEAWDDQCPAGESCQAAIDGIAACLPEGSNARGEACPDGPCARGSVCASVGDGPLCYEPCEPEGTEQPGLCDEESDRCAGILSPAGFPFDFGLCLPREAACTPFDGTCADGETCAVFGGDPPTACVPVGQNAAGSPCTGQTGECVAQHLCVNTGMGGNCYPACDDANPCASGMCQTLDGQTFGVCL